MTLDDFKTILLGLFDESESIIEGWVQESYRRAVSESGWLTQKITIASTVDGQADYAVPSDVVQLESVYVAGVEYPRINEFDIVDVQAGTEFIRPNNRGFAMSASTAGTDQITLYPTPTSSGDTITGKAVLTPAALAAGVGPDASPVFTEDLHSIVLDGAIAIGYERTDERHDLAERHEQKFLNGIARAKVAKKRRVSGHGPFMIRVAGR